MKNLRVFFPIVLLVLLTIVLSSCQSVVPSPGATDNELMIRGKIKMPFTCCTIEEPIFEDETGHYTDSWSVIPEAVVELKDLDDCNNVLSTTFADEDGYYEFDDVEPGIYIVTAYCPVPGQKNYVFKDVVVKEDGQFNYAGIPDCDSTSLALILEYLNDCFKNTTCFKMNSDIHRLVKSISADISDMSVLDIIEEAELGTLHEDFGNFIDADDEDLVDLVCNQLMGCCIGPGFTPFVDPCEGNTAPVISMPDNESINPGESASWDVNASDVNNDSLTFTLVSVAPEPTNDFSINATTGLVSWDPTCEDIGDGDTTYTITVSVSDGCAPDEGNFVITLLSEQCEPCYGHTAPKNVSLDTLTAIAGQVYTGTVTADDDDNDELTFAFTDDYTPPTGMSINSTTGIITWDAPSENDICYCSQEQVLASGQQSRVAINGYGPCSPIKVTVTDECDSTDAEFCVAVLSACVNNEPPSLTMPANDTVDPNPDNPYTWDVTANDDGIKDPLVFSLVSVTPSPNNNFSVNATTGQISWNPDCTDIDDGVDTPYTITVSVSDGCTSVQEDFVVTLLSEKCENYTVTFDKNHEDESGYTDADPKTKSVLYGSNVGTLPTAPTRTGYTFINWNTEPGGGGTEFTATTAVTADITVYAQWDLNTYTVTFYECDGTTIFTTEDVDYGELISDPGDPTGTGYTFDGWYTEPAFTNEWDLTTDTMPANDLELYAKCECDPCDPSSWSVTANGTKTGKGHKTKVTVSGTILHECWTGDISYQIRLYNNGENTPAAIMPYANLTGNSFTYTFTTEDYGNAALTATTCFRIYVQINECGGEFLVYPSSGGYADYE